MPTFLPVTGLNRSARVRIGGLTVKPYPAIAYPNLGIVDPPGTAVNATLFTEEGTGGGLTEAKFYAYFITSVDKYGNESTPSPIVGTTTVAFKLAAGKSSIKLKWTNVPHATKYKVYCTAAVTGAASAAAAKEALPKLLAEVEAGTTAQVSTGLTLTEYEDNGTTRKTGSPPAVNKTQFNPNGQGWTTYHEINNHATEGQVLEPGAISQSNLDWAPFVEGHQGAQEKPKETGALAYELASKAFEVVKAKEFAQRSTGIVKKLEIPALASTSLESSSATTFQAALVSLDPYTPLLHVTNSEKNSHATEAEAVESALTEIGKLAKYLQVLYLFVASGTGGKVLTNKTFKYLGGDNAPVVGSVW